MDKVSILTPSQCWELFMGNQPVREWLLNWEAGGSDLDISSEMVVDLSCNPMAEDLTNDEIELVASKLVSYINK